MKKKLSNSQACVYCSNFWCILKKCFCNFAAGIVHNLSGFLTFGYPCCRMRGWSDSSIKRRRERASFEASLRTLMTHITESFEFMNDISNQTTVALNYHRPHQAHMTSANILRDHVVPNMAFWNSQVN